MSLDYAEVIRLARRGRKSEHRGKALGGCLTALVIGFLVSLFRGWLFMLAIDVIHAHWWPAIPTIGYWWAVVVVALLPFGNSSSTSKSD